MGAANRSALVARDWASLMEIVRSEDAVYTVSSLSYLLWKLWPRRAALA